MQSLQLVVFLLGSPGFALVQRSMGPFAHPMPHPLCGRLTEDPAYADYNVSLGCPVSRWSSDFTDQPIASCFGPRLKVGEGSRYDYHRGIDIGTPVGTPMFALANGTVTKAGVDGGYSDPVIQIRHVHAVAGATTCGSAGGCYFANYLHAREEAAGGCCTVGVGDTVVAGQHIGYSGVSASAFEHLHFEIRCLKTAFDTVQQLATTLEFECPRHALPYTHTQV